MDSAKLSCCICLDLLKSPATIPCGHSYCMNCISSCWDRQDQRGVHSCPQCRKEFTPRPVLVKNVLLAELVEDLKKTGLQAAPADHCYAGPEDVACDVCTGRKRKAVKSCLVCLASFCDKHLQPHYESLAFRKHKLVEVSAKPRQNLGSDPDEVKISVDKFKPVPAAAEGRKQKKLGLRRHHVKPRIVDQEEDAKVLQQQVEAISVSAHKAAEESEPSSPPSVKKPGTNRPLSVPLPPAPVPGGGTSPNMQKLQQREKIIKHLSRDKPPVAASTTTKLCAKCGAALTRTQPALKAMNQVFHSSCLCCMSCSRPLQGTAFYDREGSPQCEHCFVTSLAACSRCGERITDRVLKAMGKCFHVRCFFCAACSCTLEGVPFIAGEGDKPYCVPDYHRRFSPLCETCKEPIAPAPGSNERVKLVALHMNFHIRCYRCADCARPLSAGEDDSPGYPLDGRILCIKCYHKRSQQ